MNTALAPMPQRASNSITLGFGMLSIPLSVYTGTEETRVTRKEFLVSDTSVPVGRSAVRQDTGEVIASQDVVRMACATSGAWVTLTDEEIADCTAPKGLADILTFVPVKNVGQYLASGQVQVRPKQEKGKVNHAAEKAFGLLNATMKKKKVVALVKVAMRGPARFGLLSHDGTLTFVHTADQVRTARPHADVTFTKPEMDLAEALIDAVGIDTPVITDDTAPAVQAFVDAKAAGVKAPVPTQAPAVPHDIMAALEASIAAKKGGKAA